MRGGCVRVGCPRSGLPSRERQGRSRKRPACRGRSAEVFLKRRGARPGRASVPGPAGAPWWSDGAARRGRAFWRAWPRASRRGQHDPPCWRAQAGSGSRQGAHPAERGEPGPGAAAPRLSRAGPCPARTAGARFSLDGLGRDLRARHRLPRGSLRRAVRPDRPAHRQDPDAGARERRNALRLSRSLGTEAAGDRGRIVAVPVQLAPERHGTRFTASCLVTAWTVVWAGNPPNLGHRPCAWRF